MVFFRDILPRIFRQALLLLCVLGCAAGSSGLGRCAAPPTREFVHVGLCDASAGVALDEVHFAVADDENNTLCIYRNDRSSPALAAVDFSMFLEVKEAKPETDLEGAAWLGERIYWISSHGRNKEGKFRESRHRFFATRVLRTNQQMTLLPEGRPYKHLLPDLLRNRALAPYHLDAASGHAPKDKGGFNIESLCSTPQGHLLMGFRNPIPQGKALVVPLTNPGGLISGQSAIFGMPELLELDGLGIRDMARAGSDYIVIAGSYDGRGISRLYRWAGPGHQPALVSGIVFDQFNPEAVVLFQRRPNELFLFSDDGTLDIGGQDCKLLTDARQKRFRSRWYPLPQLPAGN